MLRIGPPPLDRFMDPVKALPRLVLVNTVGEARLWMAPQAESGEFRIVLGYPSTTEGSLVREHIGSRRVLIVAGACLGSVFLVRRGQPCPLEERHGVCLLGPQRLAHPVRVVTGGAKPVDSPHCLIGQR